MGFRWGHENNFAFYVFSLDIKSNSVYSVVIMKTIKANAKSYFAYQVKTGKVIKPTSCQRCGRSNCRIVAHHPDYDQPDMVKWVCSRCHRQIHIEGAKPFGEWPEWVHEYLSKPDQHKDGYRPRGLEVGKVSMGKRYAWLIRFVSIDGKPFKEIWRFRSYRERNDRVKAGFGEILSGNNPEIRRIQRLIAGGEAVQFPVCFDL